MEKALQDSSLDSKTYRSQTLDGAGNMSGKTKGAAAQFPLKTESEKTVYFNFAYHELYLYLSKVSAFPQVLKMISTMQFFELIYKMYPKIQGKLELQISLKTPGNNVLKPKVGSMWKTCWVE